MAYAYYHGTLYNSDGSVYDTYTARYEYTKTEYDDRTLINYTAADYKFSKGGYSWKDGYVYVSYYDMTDTWVNKPVYYNGFTTTTGYTRVWYGSVNFTTKKSTNIRSFFIGSAEIKIDTATQYPISFNGNGGVNPPSTVTKYYGYDLRLPSNAPTKTGYSFVNWLSSSDGQYYVRYGLYTVNAASTMTAQWTPQTYSVGYNNNGGSGAIAATNKTYDQTAYFSNGSGFSRIEQINQVTNEFELINWNTQPDGSGTSYSLGSSIPNLTSNITVYAIWRAKYIYPFISNVVSYRTTQSSTDPDDKGEYIYITFDFKGCSNDGGTSYIVPSCTIEIDEDVYTPTLSFSSGHIGSCSFKSTSTYTTDLAHNIVITLEDPNRAASSYSAYDFITSSIFPLDFYSNVETTPNQVYMGIMHPYTRGIELSLPESFMDGELLMKMLVDPSASKTTPATLGEDKDLFNIIRDFGWYDDVIQTQLLALKLKRLLEKVAESSSDTIGEIKMYGGTTAPTGWLFCRGQAVSRIAYASLFSVIGTTYGTGDGSSTFNLPDMSERVPYGASSSDDLKANTYGGASSVTIPTTTLTDMNIAHGHGFTQPSVSGGAHQHPMYRDKGAASGSAGYVISGSTNTVNTVQGYGAHSHTVSGGAVSNLGGDATSRTAHGHSSISVVQPYAKVNYIICAGIV